MYVWRGLARIVPSSVTIPTPILLAEPSKPIAIFLFISFSQLLVGVNCFDLKLSSYQGSSSKEGHSCPLSSRVSVWLRFQKLEKS